MKNQVISEKNEQKEKLYNQEKDMIQKSETNKQIMDSKIGALAGVIPTKSKILTKL